MKLDDQVAVVTGASRGIGAAIASEMAAAGAKVIINYSQSADHAEKVKSAIISTGGTAEIFQADVSHEEDVKALINFAVEKFGQLDILVNNAGIVSDKDWNQKTVEEWHKLLSTNLIGQFLTAKYAEAHLRKSHGKIINISSTNANNTYSPYAMDYDASKAGVSSLTKNLALAFAPDVRVNAILPGWVDTEMNKDLPVDYMEGERQKIFVKRIGKPSEIAKVAVFLASDDASYVNGALIEVDGGYQ